MKMLESIDGVGKAADLVDKRFAEMPQFTDLRNFGHKFSAIQQWMGAEYKDLVKVWLAVLAPLLKGFPDHMRFLKAVTDFILITSYHSHSNSTLATFKMCTMRSAVACLFSQISANPTTLLVFLSYTRSTTISSVSAKWVRPTARTRNKWYRRIVG